MPSSVALRVSARQSTSSVAADREPSTAVDTALALLRTAVQDAGWTLDALSAEMRLDKSLISRVLNGERPLTLKFLVALPDDVEALFEQRRAEAFGLIVVAPVEGPQAVKQLVAGLFGVLSPRLPAKTSGPIKATLGGGGDGR